MTRTRKLGIAGWTVVALSTMALASPDAHADPPGTIMHNICNELAADHTPAGVRILRDTMALEGNDEHDTTILLAGATAIECPQYAELVKPSKKAVPRKGRRSTHHQH